MGTDFEKLALKHCSRQKRIMYHFKEAGCDDEFCLAKIEGCIKKIRTSDLTEEEIKNIASRMLIYTYGFASLGAHQYLDETTFEMLHDKLKDLID